MSYDDKEGVLGMLMPIIIGIAIGIVIAYLSCNRILLPRITLLCGF